jgi:hypothetical protein
MEWFSTKKRVILVTIDRIQEFSTKIGIKIGILNPGITNTNPHIEFRRKNSDFEISGSRD